MAREDKEAFEGIIVNVRVYRWDRVETKEDRFQLVVLGISAYSRVVNFD